MRKKLTSADHAESLHTQVAIGVAETMLVRISYHPCRAHKHPN